MARRGIRRCRTLRSAFQIAVEGQMFRMCLACVTLLFVSSVPAFALDDCNQIKKMEDRLRCLQNNISELSRDLQDAIQRSEPVLLHSKPGDNKCLANGQNTVYIKNCEGAGREVEWAVDPIGK
jgi:hypothetical protein